MATFPGYSRITFGFADGRYGWSENWVYNGTPTAWLGINGFDGYLNLRMPLNGQGVYCYYARAEALDGTGYTIKVTPNYYTQSQATPPTDSTGQPLPGALAISPVVPGNPDRPYSTLCCKFFNNTGGSRLIYLSGIPDNVVTDPVGPTYLPGYRNALNTWRNWVQNNGLGWLGRKSATPQAKNAIASIAVGPPATITIVAGNYAPNDLVQVGGLRGLKGYRGQFYVVSQVGQVLTLGGYTPPASVSNPRGYVQKVLPIFIQPNTFQFPFETHHNRGKGPASPVGRRKARVR